MSRLFGARRWAAALALAGLSACATGCTYFHARGLDALDMFDVGITVSSKPQFGIYGNCPFTAPGGFSKVDGHYIGLGGGKFGVMEHHQEAAGLLVIGRERVDWTKDKEAGASEIESEGEGETLTVGPFGLASDSKGNAVYRPQCAHYLHLGFLGVTANLNYKEWADFFVGWAGIDIRKDDGRVLARRPEEERLESLSAQLARPRDGLARPRDGLQLLVRTDKEAYKLDDPIVLDVQLINLTGRRRLRGDKPRDLSLYFEPFATTPEGGSAEWLFKFCVYDVYGGQARYQSPQFDVPPARRDAYYHHVTIPPRSFVGRRFIFPSARERGWLEPGLHFIVVSYEVTDEYPYVILTPEMTARQAKALGTDLAYTQVWTGRVYSNIATFRVQRSKVLGIF